MKYIRYYLLYSFGGFILERIINLIAYHEWYDNSVMIGPYQGLYGLPIVLTIFLYDIYKERINNVYTKELPLLFIAILFTALSEYLTGIIYLRLTGISLWNYSLYFPYSGKFVGFIPTTLFGIASYVFIRFVHPKLKNPIVSIPSIFIYFVFIIYIIDWFYTAYHIIF